MDGKELYEICARHQQPTYARSSHLSWEETSNDLKVSWNAAAIEVTARITDRSPQTTANTDGGIDNG
jgi:hypothetical protein